ncbi:MAG: LamG-like jellyroll fold domain-containing protein [Planctomycetota bacterium]|jgi:hypothetical protein
MFRNKRTILLVLILALALFADVANADYIFGTPRNLGPTVNSAAFDWSPSIRGDGLELYFESNRAGGAGTYDIWVSTRATKEDDWGAPTNLGAPINTSDWQNSPCISADGLELYFNDWGLWVVRRATISDPWGEPENSSLININAIGASSPSLSSDGLSAFLYLRADWDLYVSTRPTRDDLWSEPVNLGPTVNGVDSTWESYGPAISADGLVLIFSCTRPGGSGGEDLWMTRRSTIDGPWSEPVNLGPTINGDRWENAPEISPDGRSLLFCSNRNDGHGDHDIWQVSIDPVVDFNGDGKVDVKDVVIMTEHWSENYSLCDIGPTPFGDGIVDVRDLLVLAEHMEPESQVLTAHWALDETEGITARDGVNGTDDIVMGGAVWQPTGGKVNGALELDGIDDCIITGFGPNPADGPFSVEAWVKGGAAGQVIVSQPLGANWLQADASDGRLMSELRDSGGSTVPLVSETVITNGEWHRIGLVWDGSHRTLSVDGVVVAEDTQNSLAASTGGLYIGVGKDYAPTSFFSGLIDDVRIYNRAVSP